MRLWVAGSLALSFAELFVSATVHLCYGLYIFSTAVSSDICEIVVNHRLIRSRIWNVSLWETVGDACNKPNILASDCSRDIGNGPFFQGHELAPIVLVHGIFGFGKGRLGSLSYWAGAEKKDDCVLVPDLGSLTSIYDRPEDGKTMRPICLLKLCHLGVVIYDWLDIAWLKKYYNFGFDHFNLTWRQVGISGLVDGILGNIGPFASEDWILPDLSLQVSVELNSKLQTFPNTYYFSYATKKTRKLFGLTVPSSLFGIHPLLFIRTLQMCQWCYPSNVPPPNKGYNDEDWQDNDGALNTISMLYPRFPEPHPNCWFSPDFKDGQSLQQGIWYYTIVEADHILFIMNRERAGVHFDILYDSIFQRCRKQMQRGVNVPSANKALDNVCNCVENCVCHISTFGHRQ